MRLTVKNITKKIEQNNKYEHILGIMKCWITFV